VHTIKIRKVDWFGHILHGKYLLKHVIWGRIKRRKEGRTEGSKQGWKLREDEEEDVSSHWMTVRNREGTGR
jgi:hypothetical protein